MALNQVVVLCVLVGSVVAFDQGRMFGGMEQGRGFGGGGGVGQYGPRSGGDGTSYGDSRGRYVATLYNDDDVYGYKAVYPNGEAMYINYRSNDARARRGGEFARAGPGARQGGAEGRGYYQ